MRVILLCATLLAGCQSYRTEVTFEPIGRAQVPSAQAHAICEAQGEAVKSQTMARLREIERARQAEVTGVNCHQFGPQISCTPTRRGSGRNNFGAFVDGMNMAQQAKDAGLSVYHSCMATYGWSRQERRIAVKK